MKNTTKIITASLITASLIGTSLTFANSGNTSIDRSTIKTIMQKQKSGETLTTEETATLETFKTKRGGKRGMKPKFAHHLTDAEKTALESMSKEEKKAFFEKKHTEMKAERESHRNVIDKLLAGETLTAEEEVIRAEIIKKRAERKAQMEERKAKMETVKTLVEKEKSGQTLTSDEQTILDEMKERRQGHKEEKRGFGRQR